MPGFATLNAEDQLDEEFLTEFTKFPRGSIMQLGDSLSSAHPPYDSTNKVNSWLGTYAGGASPIDWLDFANWRAGSPLDNLGSAATPGLAVAAIQSTHLPTVLAAKPAYCVNYSLGANDLLAGGEAPASVFRTAEAILQAQRKVGITPILCTLPPASGGSNTGLSQTEVERYNTWARRDIRIHGGHLLDFYSILVDPATGYYKSGLSTDGLHPNQEGTKLMTLLAETLIREKLAITVGMDILAGTNATITGRANFPLFPGTIGPNLPSGTSAGGGGSQSLAAAVDGIGNEFTMTSTSGFAYWMMPTLSGVAGNEWELDFIIQTAPIAGSGGWGFIFYDQSGGFVGFIGSTTIANQHVMPAGTVVRMRGKFPTGVTSIAPTPFLVGNGSVMKLRRFTFRNPSAMSI